jgi:hypothetical protein
MHTIKQHMTGGRLIGVHPKVKPAPRMRTIPGRNKATLTEYSSVKYSQPSQLFCRWKKFRMSRNTVTPCTQTHKSGPFPGFLSCNGLQTPVEQESSMCQQLLWQEINSCLQEFILLFHLGRGEMSKQRHPYPFTGDVMQVAAL